MYHPPGVPPPPAPITPTEVIDGSSSRRGSPRSDGLPTASSPDQRFVGDLNPEARFLDSQSHDDSSPQRVSAGDIGVWVERRDRQPRTSAANSRWNGTAMLSTANAEALIDIFFAKVNVIVPVVDEAQFRIMQRSGDLPAPLVHAVCIVAAKDAAAADHLRVSQDPAQAMGVRPFCSLLYSAVRESLDERPTVDKITLIRILALLSMHCEGRDGAEQASMHIVQAMFYAQSLGLHLLREEDDELPLKKLFWSLWTLDRLNAAVNGRPIIMSDIDSAIPPLRPGQSGSVAFDIWLRISHILNQVIALYRPHNVHLTTGWEGEFFDFDNILDQLNGWLLPQAMIETLHVYYWAVCILSHRSKAHAPMSRTTGSSLRRDLVAIEVIRLLRNKLTVRELYPLPVLFFAASLALSVKYQHLRHYRLSHERQDARLDFDECCDILQNLRQTWAAADIMAALGCKVREEMSRMPDLAALHSGTNPGGGGGGTAVQPATEIPIPSACVDTPSQHELHPAAVGTKSDTGAAEVPSTTFDTPALTLFDGMDDIFATYLEPNNPLNFDDLPFMETLDHQGLAST